MAQRIRSPNPLEEADAYRRTQQLFFDFPQQALGLSSLADLLDMHKNTAREAVLKLKDEGFLRVDEIGRAWRISVDPEHLYNLVRKVPYHLELIYTSGILEAVRGAFPGARAVILFGSYRKGDDTEHSDVDIAVELVDDQGLEIQALGIVPQLGFRRDVPVNVHVFDRRHINLNLFANIANGIVLDGFLEAHP